MHFPELEKNQLSSVFIKLKDKESVTGVLRGDPYGFFKAFKEGDEPRFRFQINMVIQENGAMVAKVFEGGESVYRQLKDYIDAGYNLEEHFVKITRSGLDKQTKYSVIVLKDPVRPDVLKQVQAVQLRKLGAKAANQPAPQMPAGDAPEMPDFGDIPF